MNEAKNRHPMTMHEVVYQIPGMERVRVERDITFCSAAGAPLSFDLYRPLPAEAQSPTPAVLFIGGFPDLEFAAFVGCKFKEMAGYVTWAQLVAASGLAAITYTNNDPVADVGSLLMHLQKNAVALGLDLARLGICAFSGNVPTALSLLLGEPRFAFKSAVLCYGPLLELPGSTTIAEAAKNFGFAYPTAASTLDDWAADVPLLLVRAGKETMPGLNASINHFVAEALARNLSLTLVNHASAPHAFDLIDSTESSRDMVRRMLTFMRFHLLQDST